ncbi:MAG: alanine racemase, partial [Victivallales bacterium]|nr:alanine racemase [Victivallales bacterium]
MLPTIVKVDYTVLRDNFLAIQRAFPTKTLAPVIKADAYGHGILETARTFNDAGAKILTVFR